MAAGLSGDTLPDRKCPYKEVEIARGATVTRVTSLAFGKFYSVTPGTYGLAFQYDNRLVQAPKNVKETWVPWGKAPLGLLVKQ